uniref:Uncharacterized protein n=1 Tax=Anguilla anguilla TaxID=7936 RepID=A0A0E9RSX4_ANGAN
MWEKMHSNIGALGHVRQPINSNL